MVLFDKKDNNSKLKDASGTKKVLSWQRNSRKRSTSNKRSSSKNSIRSTASNVTMNSLTQETNMDVNETDTSDGSNSENIESSAGNSKYKSCRHLFKIVTSSNNQHGTSIFVMKI